MTIAFQSERRRGLFVLQLARAGDYEAATTQKNDEVKKMAFFKKIQNTVKSRCLAERRLFGGDSGDLKKKLLT